MRIKNSKTGAEYSSPTMEIHHGLGCYIDQMSYGDNSLDIYFYPSDGWEKVKEEIKEVVTKSRFDTFYSEGVRVGLAEMREKALKAYCQVECPKKCSCAELQEQPCESYNTFKKILDR